MRCAMLRGSTPMPVTVSYICARPCRRQSQACMVSQNVHGQPSPHNSSTSTHVPNQVLVCSRKVLERTTLYLASWMGIVSNVRRNVSPLTSSQAPSCWKQQGTACRNAHDGQRLHARASAATISCPQTMRQTLCAAVFAHGAKHQEAHPWDGVLLHERHQPVMHIQVGLLRSRAS